MNILERALAAALKSVGEDAKEVLKTAEKKLEVFTKGVEETIQELDEIANDRKKRK